MIWRVCLLVFWTLIYFRSIPLQSGHIAWCWSEDWLILSFSDSLHGKTAATSWQVCLYGSNRYTWGGAKELSAPPCENKTCHVGDSCHQIQPKVFAGYSRCWLPYLRNQLVTFGPFFVVHAIVQATKPLNEGCSCQKESCYVSATRCVCCVCVVDVVVFSACLIDVEKTPAPVGMVKKL